MLTINDLTPGVLIISYFRGDPPLSGDGHAVQSEIQRHRRQRYILKHHLYIFHFNEGVPDDLTTNGLITIVAVPPTAAFTAVPNPASCAQTVNFNGSGSTAAPGRTIVSYSWDFGDGSPLASGVTTSHSYAQYGTYNATLTVTDDLGLTDSETIAININQGNQPPVAAPAGPYLPLAGDGVTFNGSGSSDPNAACGDSIVSYEWDLTDNGSYDVTGAMPMLSPAQVASAYPLLNTPYTLRLRVTDEFGATGTATTTVTVSGPPVAAFTAIPNPAACAQTVNFDGSTSTAGTGHPIVTYSWDFGDGSPLGSGVTTTHAYTQYGTYTVNLTVTDDVARTASTSVNVVVSQGNQPPVAAPAGPYLPLAGNGVTFNGSGSSDPNAACGDSIVSYEWDLTDNGSYDVTGPMPMLTPAQVASAYPLLNTPYTLRLRVTDEFGATGTATTTVTVSGPPVAAFTAIPNPAACAQTVSFNASASTAGTGHPIVSYSWDFGDATPLGSGVNTTHAYTQYGTYTVSLTVTDDVARTASTSVMVVVNQGNQPPVAAPGGPYSTMQGSGATLNGTGSSDPNTACGDSIVSYEWDLDINGTYDVTGASPVLSPATVATFFPLTNTPYTIRLRVTDEFGATGTATTTFTVIAPTPTPTPTPPDTPPSAIGDSVDITTAGGSAHFFTVTYTDSGTNAGINVSTLDGNDIRVTGPGGFDVPAGFFGVDINMNGTPRTAAVWDHTARRQLGLLGQWNIPDSCAAQSGCRYWAEFRADRCCGDVYCDHRTANTDAYSDADADAYSDADADANSDADTDADTDTDTDADADTDAGTHADANSDADAYSDADADANADSNADSNSDPDTDADANANADADADTYADADADANSDADTYSDTDADANSDADTYSDTDPDADAKPNADAEPNAGDPV